jgi:hypothetical protein
LKNKRTEELRGVKIGFWTFHFSPGEIMRSRQQVAAFIEIPSGILPGQVLYMAVNECFYRDPDEHFPGCRSFEFT